LQLYQLYYCYYISLLLVGRKRKTSAADDKDTESEHDDEKDSTSKPRQDKNGLPMTKAGAVSMKMLDTELPKEISSRRHYPGSLPMLCTRLNVVQANTLFTFVMFGNNLPVEKNRDDAKRRRIWLSAQDYCLGLEQKDIFEAAEIHVQNAFLHNFSRSLRQILW